MTAMRVCVMAMALECVLVLSVTAAAGQELEDEYAGALVLIRRYPTGGQTSIARGFGTGWLVSYDGYVVTAAHVVTGNPPVEVDEVKLVGEVRGHSYPLKVVHMFVEEDAALLRLEWRPEQRADVIFERIRPERVTTTTPVSILGFAAADRLQPSVYPGTVSRVGTRIGGSGRLPPGVSGGPVLVVKDGPDVIAMALAMLRDTNVQDVEAEYLSVASLGPVFDALDRRGAVRSRPDPRWLPVDRRTLLFRDREIAPVVDELKKGGAALVSGAPGMEVREFSVEAGYRIWEALKLHASNLIFVDASQKDWGAILTDIVVQLGKDFMVSWPEDKKLDAIRTALLEPVRRVIIVHGVSRDTDARTLVRIRGRAALLITTMDLNAMDGLPMLPVRLEGLREPDCVAMFRAVASLAPAADAGHAQAICRRLGRAPFAVRLAAARAKNVSAERVRRVVERNPGDVVEGRLDSLYAAVFDRLIESHRRFLSSLSVIGGDSFDARAADAVGGIADSPYFLGRAAEANLVETLVSGRYRIEPLTRAYLTVRLQALPRDPRQSEAERDRALRAMIRYYLEELGGTEADYRREWPNIEYALATCDRLADTVERKRCLQRGVPRMAPFLRYWGQWSQHQTWVRLWLDTLEPDDVGGQLAALRALVEIDIEQGHDVTARELIERAQRVAGAEKDRRAIWSFTQLAHLEVQSATDGRSPDPKAAFRRAGELMDKAIALADSTPDPREKAQLKAATLRQRGNIGEFSGDLPTARANYLESLAIAEQEGLTSDILRAHHHLGNVAARGRAWEEANREYQLALDLAQGRDEGARASIVYMLASVAVQQNRLKDAEQYLSEAVVAYEALGSRYLEEAKRNLQSVRAQRRSVQ